MFKPTALAFPIAAATLALALGWAMPPPSVATTSTWPSSLVLPHPSQWVVVEEISAYTVPQGAILVVTGVGTAGQGSAGNTTASAFADGALLVKSVLASPGGWGPSSMLALDVPLSVPEGTVLTVQSGSGVNNGRLWGYLVRANDPVSSSFELPPPWEWIAIEQGTPYVVPAGKLLVMTALNRAVGGVTGACYLEIDGQREVAAFSPAGFSANVARLAIGLVAEPGQVVRALDQDGVPPPAGRAWGFLVDVP